MGSSQPASTSTVDALVAAIGDAKTRKKVAAAIAKMRAGETKIDMDGNARPYGDGIKIGVEGAKAVAAALRGSSVVKLDLATNNIGDEGAKAVLEGVRCRFGFGSKVTKLLLQNNNVSGSQGGMFTSPSGVRRELIKAWLAAGRERSGLEFSITGLG
jgi:hypothetical protein